MSFTDLPLLADLVKEHTCKKLNDDSPCTCAHASPKASNLPAVDKRLRRWEEWMQKRQIVHQRLGKPLNRTPGDLVMNSAEELRTVKEEKLALEYTRIPDPDQQRGCPGFWKMPVGLKEECGKNETYLAVLTKEEKCEVPEIEHVGHPRLIMKEKDVLPRKRSLYSSWNSSTYLQEKTAEVSHKLTQIRPHKPNFEDLFIEGVSTSKVCKIEPKPLENLDSEKDSACGQCVRDKSKEKPSILNLSINNLQLCKNMEISGTRKVYVLFDCDISISEKVFTEYVTIKNSGTVTIRFYWKRSEKIQYFRDIIPDKTDEIYFYFNKNEGIIIPGQVLQFPIWFKTLEPGTYYEQWEFYTKPRITPPNFKLIVVLQATVIRGDLDNKIDSIREELNNNIRDRLIKECLFDITSKVPYDNIKPIIYSYNKKDVFETINSEFNAFHRQPKYLYNKEVVKELQTFYKRVRRPSDPKVWNYHIDELRLLAKAKQRKEDYSKWLVQQETAKRIKEGGPQIPTLACGKNICPDYENQQLKSTNMDNITVNVSAEALIDEKLLTEQLDLIISKLECPAVEKNVNQHKCSQAYLILCTYFDKIGQEFEELEKRLGIVTRSKYPTLPTNYTAPLYYKPTRLVNESFYEILQGPPLTSKVGSKEDQPAAETLQAIPVEDSKRRYKTYYNLPDTPPPELDKGKKKGKGGKESKKGDKKDKKGDKKGGKNDKKGKIVKSEEKIATVDSDEADGYTVNELFDPYAKLDLPLPEIIEEREPEEKIFSNIDTVLPAVLRQYKYNMYVIMYNYLDKAVLNIVDMLEMQPKENIPYPVIKEFEEAKHTKRLIDLKNLLIEESAEQFKAKLLVYKYRKYSKADWKTIEIERQLTNVKSDTSLWSILRPHHRKPKLPESKPISYPINHYDVIPPRHQINVEHHSEVKLDALDIEEKPKDAQKPPLTSNISTATMEGGILDTSWEDFKDIGIQKDYSVEEEPEDLVSYIEKIVSQTSVQDLIDIKLDKGIQKELDEYVSDEEYFYDSDTDTNTEVKELSVRTDKSEEDSCGCEGMGTCNVLTEEYCNCEGHGECNEHSEQPNIAKTNGNDGIEEPYPLISNLPSYGALDKPNTLSVKNVGKCTKECK